MILMQEIGVEYLQEVLADKNKIAVKIEIVVNDEFRINETVELLKEIEKEIGGAEFFVYCPNLFNQIKIDEPDPKHNSRAVAAGTVLHTMHLDTLPYSSVLIVADRGNEDKIKEICELHGIGFEVVERLV
ncbi:MAG: hypothetical protein HY514_00915 [Candidatus Aenigmarchaeota archaeon]|nr:hypothetical protein [Candidatus Aenigmarchaeota archaeon]